MTRLNTFGGKTPVQEGGEEQRDVAKAPDTEPLRQPNALAYVALPLLHYASVKLTFMTALSPENEVVVWLPNAVLLTALLHYQGQRAWLLASLTFGSDVLANLPVFPTAQAVLLSLCNLFEVVTTYLLMRLFGAKPGLTQIQDFGKFVIAGPLIGTLASALLAAVVLLTLDNVHATYVTLVLLWWFGDSLGQLIYTPLLLSFLRPALKQRAARGPDTLVVLATCVLAWLILSGRGSQMNELLLTPNLLLPCVLYFAVRLGTRWTAVAVALISVATAWAQTTGHKPFGDASPHGMILRTQEFILALSTMGMGFAILLSEQRALMHSLEDKVRERTQALEESNRKLAALSSMDGLTGIANRRAFDEAYEREWLRCRRAGTPLSLLMMDVDMFKQYNDCYGHGAGDTCLIRVCHALAGCARRPGDFVYRYGGEEFVALLTDVDAANALVQAQRFLSAVEALQIPHAASQVAPVVSISIGIATTLPSSADGAIALKEAADRMLYASKSAGRNRTTATEV